MRSSGFTLIEVLVTLVITAIMLSAVYTCFVGTVAAKQYSEEVKAAGRVGQAILGFMKRDFTGAFVFSPGNPAMEGQTGSIGTADADTVNFVTTTDSRRAVDGKGSDYNEVGYALYPGEEQDGAAGTFSRAAMPLLRLYRREDHFLDESPFSGGILELLDDCVKSIKFEYLADEGWLTAWQGEGLPEAVRITLFSTLGERGRQGR
jgi:prepilin-type N-terminal cleavage/methylation domain-containing protein